MENRTFAKCKICKDSFDTDTLLQNTKDNYFCKSCFKERISAGAQGDPGTQTSKKTKSEFLPNPEQYVLSKHDLQSFDGCSSSSVTSLSKHQPLQCPYCYSHVSMATMEHHFRYDHSNKVPIVKIKLDTCCASEFELDDIKYDSPQCFFLLKLQNVEIPYSKEKPLILIMAARVSCKDIDSDSEESDDDDSSHNSSDEVLRQGDQIIIWAACNIKTNLSCTVAVSMQNKEVRNKFFGPMLSVQESPRKVCKAGYGLMLNHLHCQGMTENGKKPLVLEVVIHSP